MNTTDTDRAEAFDALVETNGNAAQVRDLLITMGAPKVSIRNEYMLHLERMATQAYNHYRRNGFRESDRYNYEDTCERLTNAQLGR
jgi:arginyl-tRNA--protein-N-Asp/Glu arginylyltransferase